MERTTYQSTLLARKLRGVCVCATAIYGNAASRMSEVIPTTGTYAYGGYPDIDALYKEQALGAPEEEVSAGATATRLPLLTPACPRSILPG